MKIFTAKQTKLAEKLAAETAGVSSVKLMENAGKAAADIIKSENDVRAKRCVAVCGKGGNGGDGFTVALRLFEAGAQVSAVLACGKPETEDALEMYERMTAAGIVCVSFRSDPTGAASLIADADIIVDGIFGIGFKGAPDGTVADVIECINHSGAVIYSLDIPSGIEADTGAMQGVCVNAAATVVFSLPKFAHLQLSSAMSCGRLYIADIGVPQKLISSIDSDYEITDRELVKASLPCRKFDAHKGDCGRVLAICGSYTMPGAALMCVSAAVKSGAGLVSLAIPERAYPLVAGRLYEPTYLPLPDEGKMAARLLINEIRKATAIVIGCGLTSDESLLPLLEAVLTYAKCPVIIDADGINLLSENIDLLKTSSAEIILTPHMGEMSRLSGECISDIRNDRLSFARDFAEKHGITLVLKGARTVIATKDGKVYCNLNGNPGMATAGSGDILAGLIAGLAAQGVEPHKAAAAAVYIHGMSGDLCERALGQYCMTPTDMLASLPEVFQNILTEE